MTSRRLAVILANLLFVSVAGNLFFAGWIASQSFYRPPPPDMFADIERHMEGRLTPEGFVLMQDLISKMRPKFSAMSHDSRVNRDAIVDTIEAESFDKAAFMSATAQLMKARDNLETSTIDNAADVLAKLNPADRRVVADFIAMGPPGPPPPPPR